MLHLLVCYDVSTESPAGKRRLRKVATACKDFGQRVQYSVFECTVSETHLERFRQRLTAIIDPQEDSLRIYQLGASRGQVEVYGRDQYVDFTAPLVL